MIDDLRLSYNIHETAHSRILYKFLLAHSRNERYSFLKAFFRHIGIENLFDYNNVIVRVEHENIDVLISEGKRYVIIENKVNHACDQNRQLYRYINKFKQQDVYVLYLVRMPIDKGPSDNSLADDERKEMEKEGKFFKISYQEHILPWLTECKNQKVNNHSLLGSALVQYCDYLDKILNNKSTMEKKDADLFEIKFLNVNRRNNDCANLLEIKEKVKELSDKVEEFKRVISEYDLYYKKSYLDYFKEATKLENAVLNDKGQIVFNISIKGTDIPFVYDFLKTGKNVTFVWFGTQLNNMGNELRESLLKVPSGFKIVDYDNGEDCDKDTENGKAFHSYYQDENWFCKYCKDNESAVHDIKEYLECIRN